MKAPRAGRCENPTKLQLAYILVELGKMKMALNLIFDAIIYPISGFRETDSAEDPLGVGRPYNQYLSFVVTETTRLYPLIPIEKQSGDGNFDHCHICLLYTSDAADE